MSTEANAETIEGLASKLASLDLTGDEQEALDAVLKRAASASPEVEGYGVVFEIETTFQPQPKSGLLTDDGTLVLMQKVAVGLGHDPRGVWTDMRPLS